MDGELGVDEQEALPVERAGDAVAGVRDDDDALQRRDRLALDQRVAHARPDLRRAGHVPAAVDPAPLDRGGVADVAERGGRRVLARPAAAAGGARARPGRERAASAMPARASRPGRPPRPRPPTQLHRTPGTLDLDRDLQLTDGNRSQDLDGQPRQRHVLARCPSRVASSADGGPACWWRGSHGPAVCSVARKRPSPSATKNASSHDLPRLAQRGDLRVAQPSLRRARRPCARPAPARRRTRRRASVRASPARRTRRRGSSRERGSAGRPAPRRAR